ncbi:Endonuclease/exonuclease/phosphatase [Pelagophyceae sp. CCMP2097]|nr:Endonuclease/exonuclease/phosphatase [Pelagophyceae sp. CCMP2097]
MPQPPTTGICQVNLETFATRVVRRDARNAPKKDRSALDGLRVHDELRAQMVQGLAFGRYVEPNLSFPPTFKLDPYTDAYDTSQKRRVPAWTDRVAFAGDGIAAFEYKSVQNARCSDHRPVYCKLSVLVE